MKQLFIILISFSYSIYCGAQISAKSREIRTPLIDLTPYVNPFIGTGGHGHTYPGASSPFGMIQLSPDTRYNGWDGCSGYHYSDSVIYGFSHTHLSGTGVEDYCDLLVVPQMGDVKRVPKYIDQKNGYGASFSHKNEKASPGYYAVTFDNGIHCEMTTDVRSGIHKYHFPKNGQKRTILLDLNHRDKVLNQGFKTLESGNEFSGFRVSESWAREQHFYFHMKSSATPIEVEYKNGVAILYFDNTIDVVELKVGISSVDFQGAKANYEAEVYKKDFGLVKAEVSGRWNTELQKVVIETKDEDVKVNYYTAIYHSYLAPNQFSDTDGRYRGLDGAIHQLNRGENQYTVFSLWDTYRATHPWYVLFQKERTVDFIKTFENHFLHSGDLPVWELNGNETECMIGYHAVSVIADAYLKGIKNIDVPLLINACITTSNLDEHGKKNFNISGYIDMTEEPESISKTLEYAYDSYCIYQFLKEAKKDGFQVDQTAIDIFYKRSFNFLNVYDPQTGFMRPRFGGIWHSPFLPQEVNFNFTEANSWQYSLYAPHAIATFIKVLGGKDKLEQWLDRLFSADSKIAGTQQSDITGMIGQYAHGNEPSHHMAYLYNFTDSPEKTAKYVDSILYNYYHNAPDGLSGNEDCGQMSSWYTFSAIGLYPVTPGSNLYEFGRPIVDKATLAINSPNPAQVKRKIVIEVENNSRINKYIQRIEIDGKEVKQRYITHSDLVKSTSIRFVMGDKPSSNYMSYLESPSLDSISPNFVSVPYFTNTVTRFSGSTKIEIANIDKSVEFYYSLDGSIPTSSSKKYKKPFVIKKSCVVSVIAYNPKTKTSSAVVKNSFYLKDESVHLKLETPYREQYAASGKEALIDNQFGSSEYRSGHWQGFYNVDVTATISFDKPRMLNGVGLSTLSSTRSWIFPPQKVYFYIEYEDGSTEEKFEVLQVDLEKELYKEEIIKFEVDVNSGKKVKSISFKAINYGPNPSWHISPNYNTFIFLDEFYFK